MLWLALLSFGPLLEVLQVFVGAYLIRVTGIWFGGKAGTTSIQAAIVWGNVPIAALAVFSILLMIVSTVITESFGAALLTDATTGVSIAGVILTVIQFTFVLWSIIIFVKGLASVQGFSIAKALINTIVAWSLPVALFVLVFAAAGHADNLVSVFYAGFTELVWFDAE